MVLLSTPLTSLKVNIMPNLILTETTASVSELKKNPMGTVALGEGFPIAILNRNAPAFYCVPAKAYEALMDRLEDLELNALADARMGQAVVKVSLAEL
jgi:antitoxin StbD